MFSLGLGLFFGAINVMYRDAENVVDLILMVAPWASPVLYQATQVIDEIGTGIGWLIYQLNPVTSAVNLFHFAFWRATTDQPQPVPPGFVTSVVGGGLISLTILVVGQIVFRRFDGRFAQEL